MRQNQDREYLLKTIEIAKRGYGRVSPNPYVGALVVKEGVVIGEGFHQGAGLPHAEVNAIKDAESNGFSVEGATLYVSLEPCCFEGKTPACTDLIIESKLARVVTALTDPNPKVSDRGHQILREAGIEVLANLLPEEGRTLIEFFLHNQIEKRPFVTLKAALSLDGKLATKTGDSQWITGEAARKKAHYLRGLHDAIIIGKGTLLADNPTLNVRYGFTPKMPHRLLLINDFEGLSREVIQSYQLFDTSIAPTTILYREGAEVPQSISAECEAKAVKLVSLKESTPEEVLTFCADAGLMSLFIEGGAGLYNSFINADCVDRYSLFYGPKLIGSNQALELWQESPIEVLADAPEIEIKEMGAVAESFFISADRRR